MYEYTDFGSELDRFTETIGVLVSKFAKPIRRHIGYLNLEIPYFSTHF